METAPSERTGPMLGAVEIDENQGSALQDTATGSTAQGRGCSPQLGLVGRRSRPFTVGAQWEDAPRVLQWAF